MIALIYYDLFTAAFLEGAVWKEFATFQGDNYESIESITSIKVVNNAEDGTALTRTVQINSQFVNNREHQQTVHTSTYSVMRLPTTDNNNNNGYNNTSRLQATMGFIPHTFCGQFDIWRRGEQLRAFGKCVFQKRLNEIATEAEKRFQEKGASYSKKH